VKPRSTPFPRGHAFLHALGRLHGDQDGRIRACFLDAERRDYIESVDFFESGWIKTGLREERLIYRHSSTNASRSGCSTPALEACRSGSACGAELPADLRIMIGSQWWCLRRRTAEAILAFLARRPDVMRFFRTTWIPDETFFQTLVRHLVPDRDPCRAR
jgi:hypothetical protein